MPRVTFQQTNLPDQSREYPKRKNLMQAALDAGLPVGSSCGGKGICGKCVMRINGDMSALTPPNATERAFNERTPLSSGERLSCQSNILKDVMVTTTYW